MGPQRNRSRAEAPVQLLRHAAHASHLRHRLWQRAGVHRRVQGESAADHHQLPDRQPGSSRPAGGHAGHALGGLLGGETERMYTHTHTHSLLTHSPRGIIKLTCTYRALCILCLLPLPIPFIQRCCFHH